LHILTKFLVIIAALLSVLLSGLTIAYSANMTSVLEQFRAERDKVAAANAATAEALSAQSRERESLEQERSSLQTALTQLRQSLVELQGENAKLLTDNKELQLGQTRYNTQIDKMVALIDSFQKQDEARTGEVEDLRKKYLSMTQKEIEYLDRINDLTGQLEVSQESNRALQEQIAEIRQEADAARTGSSVTSANQAFKLAPKGFRARISSVQRDAAGSLFVSIDAGSSDQLETQMKLSAIDINGRGYLATIILDRVDLNEAVGRVTLTGLNAREVQIGDLVFATGS